MSQFGYQMELGTISVDEGVQKIESQINMILAAYYSGKKVARRLTALTFAYRKGRIRPAFIFALILT
jgi:hypothetical protein